VKEKLPIMTLLRPLALLPILLSTLCSYPCFALIMDSDTGVGEMIEGRGSGRGEGHCSDDSLGNESSCGLLGPSTQTLVPKNGHGDCLSQAGRYLSCFSREFEGCDEKEKEHRDCLTRLGNRLVRSKHGYLFVSNSNQLLAASIELYGTCFVPNKPTTVATPTVLSLADILESHLEAICRLSIISNAF